MIVLKNDSDILISIKGKCGTITEQREDMMLKLYEIREFINQMIDKISKDLMEGTSVDPNRSY